MGRSVARVAALLCALVAGWGCGGSQPPSDEQIWYEASLRPSHLEPTSEQERTLLSRLDSLPSGEPVTVDGGTYVVEAPYYAASGRRCRTLRAAGGTESLGSRLACEGEGGWYFVPNPFAARAELRTP